MARWMLWLLAMQAGSAAYAAPMAPWQFEASRTAGDIRVVPMIPVYEALEVPDLAVDSYVQVAVTHNRLELRIERAEEIEALPPEVGLSLPGAVNGVLGMAWKGQFRSDHYPVGAEHRVRRALLGERDLDTTLSGVARSMHGDATLFTWVEQLAARPLTNDSFPGDLLDTEWGPVVIDLSDEPFAVDMTVGMALVTTAGEVVLRYADTYTTVVSGHHDPERAGADLARSMAAEVTKMWACDPRLDAPDARLAKKQRR